MPQRRSSSKKEARAKGFTLVEVVVSTAVLSVGLLGVAALISGTLASGTRARYMNMANVLASEKLDNLNKWPSNSADVAPGGSLTGPAICAAGDIYCDQITVSEAGNADSETQTQVDANGALVTTSIVHTSTGCVGTPANCGVADPVGAGSTFTRRWLITPNPTITSTAGVSATVTGARRITVLVTLNGQSKQSPVKFQMSMVRP